MKNKKKPIVVTEKIIKKKIGSGSGKEDHGLFINHEKKQYRLLPISKDSQVLEVLETWIDREVTLKGYVEDQIFFIDAMVW